MQCRYRQVEATRAWQLTVRVDNRCGEPHLLETVRTGFGQPVTVPSAGPRDVVVASFSLSLPLTWQLADKMFRAKPLRFVMNEPAAVSVRFLSGTATGMHVLRPAMTLGYHPQFKPRTVERFRVSLDGSPPSPSGVAVSFYAIALSP